MTPVDIRIPGDLHDRIMSDIAGSQEWAGYLLCGVARIGDSQLLLGRDWVPVPVEYQITDSGHGFSWHPDFDILMLNRIQKENLSAVVLHYHGGRTPRLGMNSDRQTAQSLMPFLSREAQGRPHVFGVFGNSAASGIVYFNGDETGPLNGLRIAGSSLEDWLTESASQKVEVPLRQDRMVRGFGHAAFERLRSAKVGVIGCGGGGSHVIQQLAYLGVGSLVLIDSDDVEETNLNRLIGASPKHTHRSFIERLCRKNPGDVGRPKVEVMRRLVDSIDEDLRVETFYMDFPTSEVVNALRDCDVIIACVDKLQVRDDLNRFSKRYLIPLLDIGIEITPDVEGSRDVQAIPGRVTKVLADGPCLRCQGVIDDTKLLKERDGKPFGYTGTVNIPDPAVVTLNGIVASIASTEVLQMLTGFAESSAPNCGWMYDGIRGTVDRVEKSYTGCVACLKERALGDPGSW